MYEITITKTHNADLERIKRWLWTFGYMFTILPLGGSPFEGATVRVEPENKMLEELTRRLVYNQLIVHIVIGSRMNVNKPKLAEKTFNALHDEGIDAFIVYTPAIQENTEYMMEAISTPPHKKAVEIAAREMRIAAKEAGYESVRHESSP